MCEPHFLFEEELLDGEKNTNKCCQVTR